MSETSSHARRGGGGSSGRPRLRRRLLTAPVLGLLTAAVLLLLPALASADTSSTLTVIGTSDVSDSGLIPNVIQPGFQKAFPQYTFKYIGTGTGNAISMAESGAAGASNLIVHAASLENQFVANGYSFEQYGRALWTNDFVLASSQSDPAGVAANAGSNIAQAFADVATAGINGGGTPKITFVSRGGTPGTTVAEHGIWQLVQNSGLSPSGLLLCAVSSANGGGLTPIAAGNGVTASGQPCPKSGALPTGAALPKWYVATGLTQGPNVQAANACNGFPSGPSTCYVFTDSGTYHYLASGTDPAGTIPALKIVSQNNAANAPGGQFELINYFHGYIINPGRPGQTVNLPAAKDFLNYITSPAVQAQVASYLASQGSPFKPTASPFLTASRIPSTFVARSGRKLTLTGTLTNAQPGFPVLSGEPVIASKIVNGLPVQVATAKTNGSGGYSLSFAPPTNGSYAVTTNQIAKVEEPTLNPVFGDLLSPASTTPAKITVHSVMTQLSSRSQGGQAVILGQVSPDTGHVKATATLSAKLVGSKKGFKKVATAAKLAGSDANFAVALTKLAKGTWLIRAKFQDPGQVVAAPTRTIKVKVGSKPSTSVSFSSVTIAKGGKLTVSGKIKPGAPSGKATIEVLAMKTAGGPPKFGEKTKVKLSRGKTKFTAHFKLKTGFRWVLRLTNNQSGKSTSDTGLRTSNVK